MSMAVVALLMRAWIMEMKHYAVQPRLLADDLQILSTGERHLNKFQHAYDKTHLHLQQMGAEVAPQKFNTFFFRKLSQTMAEGTRMAKIGEKSMSDKRLPRLWGPFQRDGW